MTIRLKKGRLKNFLLLVMVLSLSAAGWADQTAGGTAPDEDSIGIPIYPGAKVYTSKEASKMNANGVDFETLPILILTTDAGQDEVTAFYKEKLKNWKYKNSFGMFDVFWQEGDDFEFMDITKASTTPNVIVQAAIQPVQDEIPGSKVQIQIVYSPKK